jgi:acetyl-CoA carboxylase biotin carboxyl carrier protein
MNIEEIKELAKILSDHDLSSLAVTENGTTIKLEKHFKDQGGIPSLEPVREKEVSLKVQDKETQTGGTVIPSPVVGVFYASPSPEAKPYVTVGCQVKKGDVLCIIEAMKLMNEIYADRDGTILEVCAANEQVVEYGQPLFLMR